MREKHDRKKGHKGKRGSGHHQCKGVERLDVVVGAQAASALCITVHAPKKKNEPKKKKGRKTTRATSARNNTPWQQKCETKYDS